MPLRRLFMVAGCLICSVLSCGKAKTFDSVSVRGPMHSQQRSQNVNALAAADAAVLLLDRQLAFIVGETTRRRNNLIAFLGSLRAATPAPPEPLVAAVSSTSLEPCGGDLPPCFVKQRESGGDYAAYNPSGCGGFSCGGAWQFDPRTWNNYGGYEFAQDAPPEVQDAKARELYAGGAGSSHWGVG